MIQSLKDDRASLRVLRFLARGEVQLREAAVSGRFLLDGGERGVVGIEKAALARLKQSRLVLCNEKVICLTKAGEAALKGAVSTRDLMQAQPIQPDEAVIISGQEPEKVTINRAESPLALLHRRKGKNGQPFIDAREFRAGERMRADYTRGQIMPRLGVNWNAAGMAGRSHDRAGSIHELTDAALAARQRVEKAIEAVGPELSGVLIDICCFLKGMEQVEAERNWPARSAKIVLKSALGALARHYEPQQPDGSRQRRPSILHWGAPDYRPKIK